MSVQAITHALAVKGLGPSEKLLLLVLANYADEHNRCWPSQSRLAEDTGLTDRTIRTVLASLEAKGLLSRVTRNRRDGSRGTDVITLELHRKDFPPEDISTGNLRHDHRKSTTASPETVSGLTTFEPSRTVIEPPTSARGFVEFWRAYPEKVGKRAAEAAYAKALKRIGGDDAAAVILAGVMRAKHQSDKWRRGIIPNPATWLNQDRWEDAPAHQEFGHDRQPSPSPKREAREQNYARAFHGALAAAGPGDA